MGKDAYTIYIQAICRSVNDTVQILDLFYYNPLTSDNNHYTITGGSATINYSNDGLKITGTATTDTTVENTVLTLPDEYTAEFDITNWGTDAYSCSIGFEDVFMVHHNNNKKLHFFKLSTNTQISNTDVSETSTSATYKIERTGTSIKLYKNNTLIRTLTNISTTHNHYIMTYKNRWSTIKNLKIHEL